MDSATFDRIANKIRGLTGLTSIFNDLQLISYDENTHHAVIQVKDFLKMNYVKTNCTHEVIEAFDSVLGVETTVSCVRAQPKRKKPHERFVM